MSDPPLWPAHHRVAAASARATAVAAGFLPLAVWIGMDHQQVLETVGIELSLGVCLGVAFVTERRDSSLPSVYCRLLLAGLVSGLAVPATIAWLEAPTGLPAEQIEWLATLLSEPYLVSKLGLSMAVGLVLGSALLLAPFLVRTQSERLWPQVAAWLGLTTLLAGMETTSLVERGKWEPACLPPLLLLVLGGPLAALFLQWAEGRLVSWGVAGPRPELDVAQDQSSAPLETPPGA